MATAIKKLARVSLLVLGIPLLAGAAPPQSGPGEIADALTALAFDANPKINLSARDVLGRWAGPLRLFVFADAPGKLEAGKAAAAVSKAAKLPIQIVAEDQVVSLRPNSFLVLSGDVAATFRGPLRAMLDNAFHGDAAAIDDFITGVIALQPCWTLPIWTDASRITLQAAIFGVDTKQTATARQRCLVQQFGAAMGLLGPAVPLEKSIFNPKTLTYRLSRQDVTVLRLLYSPALQPGMTRAQTHAAALAALEGTRP